ncbi:MAG: U32 family peptidase, partial [Spirochaetia bacterium]|jgi:putative protease|nr:U32 family peptidase [Spirochaetia bacterium]
MAAADEGVDRIYVSGDILNPDKPFSLKDIQSLQAYIKNKRPGAELYLGTPRMMNEMQFEIYKSGLQTMLPYIDGILIGNLGAAWAFKNMGVPLAGDYPLNVFNSLAADFYRAQGTAQVTASIELNAACLKKLCKAFDSIELIAHGRIETMYFDHDFFEIYGHDLNTPFMLYNEAGGFEIYRDQHHRTHLLTKSRFTILPLINDMRRLGIYAFRIEAQTEKPEALREIIRAFKEKNAGAVFNNPVLNKYAYSYEALRFK